MPIVTNTNRILRAINYTKLSNLYLGISQTSDWASEPTPDTPSGTELVLNELIYVKRIDIAQLVLLNMVDGALTVGASNYDIVPEINAFTEEAMSVYFSTTIEYGVAEGLCNATDFRQYGILYKPTDASGVLNEEGYDSVDVIDQGHLLYLNNIEVVSRTNGQTEEFKIIIDF